MEKKFILNGIYGMRHKMRIILMLHYALNKIIKKKTLKWIKKVLQEKEYIESKLDQEISNEDLL
jgi:hypothetical protein